jgi:hypothetical protein
LRCVRVAHAATCGRIAARCCTQSPQLWSGGNRWKCSPSRARDRPDQPSTRQDVTNVMAGPCAHAWRARGLLTLCAIRASRARAREAWRIDKQMGRSILWIIGPRQSSGRACALRHIDRIVSI